MGRYAADMADVLSTQSTKAPDVVNGINESMKGRYHTASGPSVEEDEHATAEKKLVITSEIHGSLILR